MTQSLDNIESQAVARFSQGPEKDISVDMEHAIAARLNELPSEISSVIEAMDPFTRRSFLSAYEAELRGTLNDGKEIGEESATYQADYERYGWQYDDTAHELSPEIKAVFERRRIVLLSRVATGLQQQIELRGENDE